MNIMKLAPSKHREGRWLVWLDDGSLIRLGRNEVADFGLYQGMELDEKLLRTLLDAAEEGAMKRRALDALTARPMSRKELVDKLTAKPRRRPSEPEDGEAPQENGEALKARADAVADRLEELGLLNDEAYAAQVAQHCAAKGYGARRIRDELFRRGVPRAYWDAALEQVPDPAGSIDAFVEKKLRGWTGDPKELKRVSDALARRGFSWQDISAALRRYEAELEEEP